MWRCIEDCQILNGDIWSNSVFIHCKNIPHRLSPQFEWRAGNEGARSGKRGFTPWRLLRA